MDGNKALCAFWFVAFIVGLYWFYVAYQLLAQ
jgi:hypothetical protein